MLNIEPKYIVGSGIFDIARKLTNSTAVKKIINSTAKKNWKRAANSVIGKEIKKSVLSGVSEASKNAAAEEAFQQLGVSPAKKRKRIKKKKGDGIVLDQKK